MGDEASKVLRSAVRPPNAGKGRKKGVPNKVTKALKDMILGALDDAGGQDYLAEQAKQNPAAFMTLVGKVLPLDITSDGKAIGMPVITLGVQPEA